MVDGSVLDCGYSDTYGNYVHIKVNDDTFFSYNHLNKILVKKGQIIESGKPIGLGGSTGLSTAPHLHLSIFVLGEPINPVKFVQY